MWKYLELSKYAIRLHDYIYYQTNVKEKNVLIQKPSKKKSLNCLKIGNVLKTSQRLKKISIFDFLQPTWQSNP